MSLLLNLAHMSVPWQLLSITVGVLVCLAVGGALRELCVTFTQHRTSRPGWWL
jgi:hypothetical protein